MYPSVTVYEKWPETDNFHMWRLPIASYRRQGFTSAFVRNATDGVEIQVHNWRFKEC